MRYPYGEDPAACYTTTVCCSVATEATCEGIKTTIPASHPHQVMQDTARASPEGPARAFLNDWNGQSCHSSSSENPADAGFLIGCYR
jgi:hypothetical protein